MMLLSRLIWEGVQLLKLKNLTVKYGSFTAIKNINIEVKKGKLLFC